MENNTIPKPLWQCPQCGRQFERQGQSHSCKPFALELHFAGKETGKVLYEQLKQAVENRVGEFRVESLECCIHFVHTSTFAAVKIFKNKIRVDFSLNRSIESERMHHTVRMSAHRTLYYIDILTATEIDEELLGWIQEAYGKY